MLIVILLRCFFASFGVVNEQRNLKQVTRIALSITLKAFIYKAQPAFTHRF
jgi:hypothetical protein